MIHTEERIIIETYNIIDIAFENISYSVQTEILDQGKQGKKCCQKEFTKKTILKGVSGISKARQVTAIMGASGAGKTTLLNVLSCRVPMGENEVNHASGKIYANQMEYSFEKFCEFANYVMQSDILLQTLTVRETLEYIAQLKLNLSEEERRERVDELIKNLKLQKCEDTLVGGKTLKGISGGQKKRTSIAFQLISSPPVILLDEPTSGLDSLTAFIVCRYLKKLAKQENKTILLTVHQPNLELFNLFDRLILMAEGKIVYQGKADNSIEYFSKMGFKCPQFSNPPDYFISVLHHESSENVQNYPKYLETYKNQTEPEVSRQIESRRQYRYQKIDAVSYCQVLSALLKKDMLNTVRKPMGNIALIFQAIFIGLFIGGLYFNLDDDYFPYNSLIGNKNFSSLTGLLFFIGMVGLMSSLPPIALTFPIEKLTFFKESSAGLYSTGTYFLSKNITEIPFVILLPMIMSLIIYWMVGLAPEAMQFFTFYFIFVLMSFIGNSLGFLIGSLIDDVKLVSIMVPVVVLPFVMFSGFFKNREDLPNWLGWMEYISPIKYSFNGLMENQVLNLQSPIEELHFNLNRWECIYILIGLGIGIRLVALFFLWLKKAKLQ